MTPRLMLSAALVALALSSAIAPVHTQAPAAAPELEVLHVKGNVFAIFGAGGNIAVSVGKDGVFVVDTGMAVHAPKVLEAIARIQRQVQALEPKAASEWGAETRGTLQMSLNPLPPLKPIRFVVNTHAHPDHVGGNGVLRKAGRTFTGGNVAGDIADAGSGAMVLAHENVMNRLMTPPTGQAPAPEADLPTDTFFGTAMKFSHFFNGEGIQLLHPKNAHTDGDVMVVFRGSDVIVTGDLFQTTTFPFIDIDRGGHINGVIDAVNTVLDLSVPEFRLEGGTMIVPGHGRLTDMADVAYYRDMLTIVRDRVQDMAKRGLTLEQVKQARPTRDYDPRWGATSGFWTTDQFVEAVYKNVAPPPAKPAPARRGAKGAGR